MPDPTIALPITISPYLTLQTPLSRRGIGPGLILIAEENAPLGFSDRLDPPPLQKWAEEGFAVVQLLVKDGVVDGMKMGIERAVEVLRHCEQCSVGVGVGVVCMCIFSFVLVLVWGLCWRDFYLSGDAILKNMTSRLICPYVSFYSIND